MLTRSCYAPALQAERLVTFCVPRAATPCLHRMPYRGTIHHRGMLPSKGTQAEDTEERLLEKGPRGGTGVAEQEWLGGGVDLLRRVHDDHAGHLARDRGPVGDP